MVQYGYKRGGAFNFPTPSLSSLSADITPPEGKSLSDFVCWIGFEDKNHPISSDQYCNIKVVDYLDPVKIPLSNLVNCIVTQRNGVNFPYKFSFDEVADNFNLYAVWESYRFNSTATSVSGVKCNFKQGLKILSQSLSANNTKDNLGFYDKASSQPFLGTIYPNFPVKWDFSLCANYGLKNVYMNGNKFAGVDVTEEYWTEHKDDLYKDIPSNLSGNYVWSEPLEDTTTSVMLYLPSVTEHHLSSDNKTIFFTFDTYKLSGDINLYASYDEAKTVMA